MTAPRGQVEADVSSCQARTPPDGAHFPRHAGTGQALAGGVPPSGPGALSLRSFQPIWHFNSTIIGNGAPAALIAPARIDMGRIKTCVDTNAKSGHLENRAISITNALAHTPLLLGLWLVCGAFGVNFGNFWQQKTISGEEQ